MLDTLLAPLPAGAGRVGLLSSDEFLERALPFDEELLEGANVERIGVILCADHAAAPQSLGFARKHFHRFGIDVVDVPSSCGIDPLPAIDLLYLGGGNPKELLECILARDGWWDGILDRWRQGMHLAGSSAGAMILCEHALGTCPCTNPHHEWGQGLGPVMGVGLAVHADRRSEEWLDELPKHAPAPVVAMDEGVGVLLQAGNAPKVAGDGRVWILGK